MIDTIHPHDPDRCPRDAKTYLYLGADRDTISKRLETCHGGGWYF